MSQLRLITVLSTGNKTFGNQRIADQLRFLRFSSLLFSSDALLIRMIRMRTKIAIKSTRRSRACFT